MRFNLHMMHKDRLGRFFESFRRIIKKNLSQYNPGYRLFINYFSRKSRIPSKFYQGQNFPGYPIIQTVLLEAAILLKDLKIFYQPTGCCASSKLQYSSSSQQTGAQKAVQSFRMALDNHKHFKRIFKINSEF